MQNQSAENKKKDADGGVERLMKKCFRAANTSLILSECDGGQTERLHAVTARL
jgi:hypothetical protein